MEQTLILPDTNVLIYYLGGREPYVSRMKEWITKQHLPPLTPAIILLLF